MCMKCFTCHYNNNKTNIYIKMALHDLRYTCVHVKKIANK